MKNNLVILTFLFCICTGCSVPTDGLYVEKNKKSDAIHSENSQEIYNSNFLLNHEKLILIRKEPCRIKYHKLNSLSRNILIEGKIGIDGNK